VASSQSKVSGAQYCGSAILSDGTTEHKHDIEIHTTIGEHAASTAWHIIVKPRLTYEFSEPLGKPVVIELLGGVRCTGSVIDPKLVRGTGPPPC